MLSDKPKLILPNPRMTRTVHSVREKTLFTKKNIVKKNIVYQFWKAVFCRREKIGINSSFFGKSG